MFLKTLLGLDTEHFEHERLISLVNNMTDAVIAVNEEVKVVLCNAAALGVLDLNNINVGIPLADIFKPVDKDNQPVDINKMISETTVPMINRDLKLKYGDTSMISLYMSITPVKKGYGKDNKSGGHVIMLRDITREKSLEEEREEFISVVSHELRTPVAVTEGNISNALMMFEKNDNPEDIKKALNEAHGQIVFLADMINDLATLSRAERNKLEIEVEDIDTMQLLNSLLVNYSSSAQVKGLELRVKTDSEIPHLSSSELYVKEILQNFITNAIKYTSEGTVTVEAAPYDKGLEFKVIDTGIGISKTDQEKVFDKFFRSEDYRTRQANGTGLGLYITMKLAKRLNAEINLESEQGKGSTFIIRIPNLAPSPVVAEPAAIEQVAEQPAASVESPATKVI